MFYRQVSILLVLLSCWSVWAEDHPSRHFASVDGIDFELPDGLMITKVAGPPLVRWPIVADFDSQGRLVVAESGGVGWPIQQHNEQKLHKIVRLVDRDADGHYDDRVVAADQLAFPEGVLCVGNDILVSAPPVIWRLIDGDGDGVCERREVWFDGTTVTNCANDLHGPYMGRDGWIYWCKGAFGEQSHSLLDGRTWTSSAAHIYRRKLHGGQIEPVISGGMDNPVEVAITPEGDKFFTSTFLQHPADGKRDGIGHAVYGAVFGKDHRVVEPLWHTGPLMKPMTHLGPAAPSGLAYLESPACKQTLGLEPESRVLAAALFNLHKLTLHELRPDGSTYRTIDHDLVRTEQVDFHPTDVIEADDGSLLLIDTGGWYDLCCPTSRVDQKTADGGIYRIAPNESSPDTRSRLAAAEGADPEDVIATLFQSLSWRKRAASDRLTSLGANAIKPLSRVAGDSNRPLDQRQEAVWALCRLESDAAIDAVASLVNQSPEPIQLTCLQVLALHRHAPSKAVVESMLDHDSLHVQRVAATTLGRIGDWDSAAKLLQSIDNGQGDRHLQHARRYALMEIAHRHPDRQLAGLADSDATLHAVLLVHQQLNRLVEMDVSELFDALDSEHAELRETVTAILAAQPQFASQAGEGLQRLWTRVGESDPQAAAVLLRLLEAWKAEPEVSQRVARGYASAARLSEPRKRFLAQHLNQITVQPLTSAQLNPLLPWTQQATDSVQESLLGSLANAVFDDDARSQWSQYLISRAEKSPNADERLRWLSATPPGTSIRHEGLEQTVVQSLLEEESSLAPEVLSRIQLGSAQANRLANAIERLPSRHLSIAIEAVARSKDAPAIFAMLDQLTATSASRTLPDGYLVNLFRQSPPEIKDKVARVTEQIQRPAADVEATVNNLLKQWKSGDPVRGLQVFRSSKAACSACHQMGYIGKNIGPELTRIGQSRTREALLEAILFPSSRIEQSYQSTQVLTVDGRLLNGLVRQRSEAGLEIQIEAERVLKLRQDEIESERPSNVSVMPSGLSDVLSPQDLADLVALLENAK